jgi:hypothetical protein
MYRFVELNDPVKPFQISIKQMSGDMIKLGTDPGDTISDVIQFLSWHLGEYRTSRIVLMDENGPLKPATVITSDLELNLYVETDADVYGELYTLTFDIGKALLHLEEEYRHLIEIGSSDDILEDFVDGWGDNILPNIPYLPSDPRLVELQGIAIRLIEASTLSPEKKESLIGRLMSPPEPEEEEFEPDDIDPYDHRF